MTSDLSYLDTETAGNPPVQGGLSLVVDIKAFKGKGAVRLLMHDYRHNLARVHAAMADLAAEVNHVDAPITLRLVRDTVPNTGGERGRLRWGARPHDGYLGFDRIRALFRLVPAPLHPYYERVNQHAEELNALEAVLRGGATQLESFLNFGKVRRKSPRS